MQFFLVMAMSFLLAGEDDLQIVRSAVTSLAGRWKDLGISLGMRAGDLDAILLANANSPNDCQREMLLRWLKQGYNVCTTIMSIPLSYLAHFIFITQSPLVMWVKVKGW